MFTKISYKSFFGSGSRRYSGIESKKLGELKKIDVVIGKFFKLHERQYKHYLKRQEDNRLSRERATGLAEETRSESKLGKVAGGIKSLAKGVANAIGLTGIIDLLLKLAVLSWVANPNNREALIGLVKFLKFLFDIAVWTAGFAVGNILDGLYQIIDGPILSKIFGVLKLVIGLFALRYLLKPWKIISDLKNIWKSRKTIQNVWKGFVDGAKNGLKPAIEGVLKALPSTANLFKHGLKRGLTRAILKVFGKGGFRILSGASKLAAKAGGALLIGAKSAAVGVVGKGAARTVGKVFSKVPIVGPLIGLAINLALGDPLDKAIFKAVTASAGQAIGSWIGGAVGTAAGTVVPVVGNLIGGAAGVAIGSILGGLVGDFLGDKAYDWFKQGSDTAQKTQEQTPQLAAGGIVTKETKAIIGEAGPEAVIPLKELGSEGIVGSKIIEPFKIIGSAILGTMFKVITSFGPLGVAIVPILKTILGPSIKTFGLKSVATSGIASNREGSGNVSVGKKLTTKKSDKKDKKIIGEEKINIMKSEKDSEGKKEKYQARRNKSGSMRSLLGDILNNIIQLDFASKASAKNSQSPGPGGGNPDGGPIGNVKMEPGKWNPVLELILREEAGRGGLEAMYPSTTLPGATKMTIAQVASRATGAVGAWQNLPQHLNARARAVGLDPTKDLYNQANQQKIAEYLIGPGQAQVTVEFAKKNPKQAMFRLSKVWAALPKDDSGVSYYAGVGNNAAHIKPKEVYNAFEKLATGGVINPIPSQNISSNKGGYPADTGLDILTPVGSRVVAPVSGTLEYAEKGHVAQMGQDANPNMPGKQDQHSVRIKLDSPFEFSGKKVNFFYGTHLYTLNSSIANKSGIKINAGDFLGLSGVANKVPHVHVGFVEDRAQNSFLNYQQVRSLLSGAPVKDAGGGETAGDHGPTGSDPSDTAESAEKPLEWTEITAHFKTLTGALRGAPELPAAGTGPKVSGMTLDQISQAYSKNTKPIIPLNNVVISGGTTQYNSIVTQDFSAFATPEFSVDSANKFKFTGRL